MKLQHIIGTLLLKTLVILSLALLPLTLKADQPLPEGDQHVARLEQELDDVLSANILLKRCLDQGRASAEVVNAANVMADNYERLSAHLTQFYYWMRYSGKPSDFSISAQKRMSDLDYRFHTVVTSSFQELGDDINKHPQYNQDLMAVAKRLTSSLKAMQTLMSRADGK